MTPSRQLQEVGFAVLLDERPDQFTVDGIAGEKLGVLDGFTYGNSLTDQGVISLRTGQLTVHKSVWTPLVGQMVNIRGLNLRVHNIHDADVHVTAILIEAHQN